MEVRFSSAASREVRDAAAFYESEVDGLGKAFIGKLRDGIKEVRKNPLASRVIRGDFRRYLLSRFPYGIIFRIDEDKIFIAAVMHLRRKPSYWEDQLSQDSNGDKD